MIGNRRSDEPTKTKKGLSSFLDAARWNRGEPQGEVPGLGPALTSLCCPHLTIPSLVSPPDFRHPKVEVDGNGPKPRASSILVT